MKNLTVEQIKAELERVEKESEKLSEEDDKLEAERDKLRSERNELEAELKRRKMQQLAPLSDEELVENLRTLEFKRRDWQTHRSWKERQHDDETVRLIEAEIARRRRERKAALRRQEKARAETLSLAETSTEQLVEMATGISYGEPSAIPVDPLRKELMKRKRPIQKAIDHLELVRNSVRNAKTVRDPPLKVIPGGGER
jgi:hypothetical protein